VSSKPGSEKEIRLIVHLDEQRVPERIEWDATEKDPSLPSECQAMMLSMWNRETRDTLRIDLWTKDMPVEEMDAFTTQTLLTLADTYENATGRVEFARALREFGQEFARRCRAASSG
jgi:gliding motility-associated protein GldC